MAKPATNFGKALRTYRVQRDETLHTMATAVNVSSAYLSGVETGKKKANDSLVSRLISYLDLDDKEAKILRDLAMETGSQLTLSLDGVGNVGREAAAMFARSFEEENYELLRHILTTAKSRRSNKVKE